jgi:hypothetical protein
MSRRRPRALGQGRVVVLDLAAYLAPRTGSVAEEGRVVRRAACGHDVYLSPRGVDAVERRQKQLICAECMAAIAAEHGARLGVLLADPGDVMIDAAEEPPE